VRSRDQLADIMMKPIPREQFEYLGGKLGIRENNLIYD